MSESAIFIVIFSGIWSFVGVIFLIVGLGLRRSFLRKEERLRARTPGTVTEIVRRRDGNSVAFFPIVSFDFEGRTIALESDAGGGRRRYYEGQPVEVLYDPDDPTCFRLEGQRGTGTVGKVFLAVGLGCVAMAVLAALIVVTASGITEF